MAARTESMTPTLSHHRSRGVGHFGSAWEELLYNLFVLGEGDAFKIVYSPNVLAFKFTYLLEFRKNSVPIHAQYPKHTAL